MDTRNFSQGRYANDGVNVPVKLGIYESTNGDDYDLGCVPANVGIVRRFGDRTFFLGNSLVTTVAGQYYTADESATTSDELLNYLPVTAAGATQLVVTGSSSAAWAALGTATKDYYKDGFIVISNGAGEGYCYKIRGSTAASGTGSSLTSTLDLYDALAIAVDASTDVMIVLNHYKYAIICNTGTDHVPLGVQVGAPRTYSSVTGPIYSWYQTWGYCSVDSAGQEAAGEIITSGAGGAVAIQTGFTAGIAIGVRVTKNTGNDDFGLAYLTIRP